MVDSQENTLTSFSKRLQTSNRDRVILIVFGELACFSSKSKTKIFAVGNACIIFCKYGEKLPLEAEANCLHGQVLSPPPGLPSFVNRVHST